MDVNILLDPTDNDFDKSEGPCCWWMQWQLLDLVVRVIIEETNKKMETSHNIIYYSIITSYLSFDLPCWSPTNHLWDSLLDPMIDLGLRKDLSISREVRLRKLNNSLSNILSNISLPFSWKEWHVCDIHRPSLVFILFSPDNKTRERSVRNNSPRGCVRFQKPKIGIKIISIGTVLARVRSCIYLGVSSNHPSVGHMQASFYIHVAVSSY